MSLEAKINEELKAAIKAGERVRMDTIRSIRAAIIEFNKSGLDREMNEQDEIKILNNQAKRRRDSILLYEQGGRQDAADKEKMELGIIEEFLPKQMDDAEVKEIIKKIAAEVGATEMKDLGKVMGAAMKQLSGKADGTKVQQFVKEILGQ